MAKNIIEAHEQLFAALYSRFKNIGIDLFLSLKENPKYPVLCIDRFEIEPEETKGDCFLLIANIRFKIMDNGSDLMRVFNLGKIVTDTITMDSSDIPNYFDMPDYQTYSHTLEISSTDSIVSTAGKYTSIQILPYVFKMGKK